MNGPAGVIGSEQGAREFDPFRLLMHGATCMASDSGIETPGWSFVGREADPKISPRTRTRSTGGSGVAWEIGSGLVASRPIFGRIVPSRRRVLSFGPLGSKAATNGPTTARADAALMTSLQPQTRFSEEKAGPVGAIGSAPTAPLISGACTGPSKRRVSMRVASI